MTQFGDHLRRSNPIPDGLREKWQACGLVPLWETTSNIFAPPREKPRHWAWSTMRPILLETAEITDPAIIERRVMQLVNTSVEAQGGDATAGLMNAALQGLRPGESAAPHRHSVNALRFVLEGSGARTIVDGHSCEMSPGDLVLTPGHVWHEHRHDGGTTSLWLDILDANLHRVLGQAIFEPGPPPRPFAPAPAGAIVAAPGILPDGHGAAAQAPMFRYPWSDAARALDAAPRDADGARRVRYVNPRTGGSCLPLIDCLLMQIDAGAETDKAASPADMIVSVVEGSGCSRIGEEEISWSAKDTFTIPRRAAASHVARGSGARLFFACNEEVYRRLGLMKGR